MVEELTATESKRNEIVPYKKHEELLTLARGQQFLADVAAARQQEQTDKINGLIFDIDSFEVKIDAVVASQSALLNKIESAARWNLVRDCIMILLLAMILAIIGFNTSQLWNWN